MPTVLRLLNWRFHFYSDEGTEPAHIHVDTGDGECKFWLEPVQLAKSVGYNARELSEIRKLITDNLEVLRGRWNEYFSGQE